MAKAKVGLHVFCPYKGCRLFHSRFRPDPRSRDTADAWPVLEVFVLFRGADSGAARFWGERDGTGFPALVASCLCRGGQSWTLDPVKISPGTPARGYAAGKVLDFIE